MLGKLGKFFLIDSLSKSIKFFFISLLVVLNSYANVFNDLVEQGKKDFRANPVKVFQGFVYSSEDVVPVFFKRSLPIEWRLITRYPIDNIARNSWKYRFNLSSDFIANITSIINYSFKATVVREEIFLPQMDISLGHLFYLPFYRSTFSDNFFKTVFKDTNFQSFYLAYILSKSLTHNLKIFGGYRYNYGFLSLIIPQNLREKFYSDTWNLHTFVLGITHLVDKSNWEISTYLGYSFLEQDVYLKFDASYSFITLGLAYYPQNIFIIKPQIKLFWRF